MLRIADCGTRNTPGEPAGGRFQLFSPGHGRTRWRVPGSPRHRVLYTLPMALISDRAIVLRRLDYSETSQILALFTREHGQVRVIAKGIKRGTRSRFAVGIDLLELGHVVWSARADRAQNLAILTEWKQVNAFVGLRERLERLHAAQYAAEVTAELTVDHDAHPKLFDDLHFFLEQLSVVSCQSSVGSPQSSESLVGLCEFQRSLLIEIGLMPQCENCVGCRSAITPNVAEGVCLTSHEGGLLCRDCEAGYVEKRLLSPGAIRVLSGGSVDQRSAISDQRSALSTQSPVLSPQSSVLDSLAGEVFTLLNYHISHLMHKEPRLAEYVLQSAQRRKRTEC